MYKYIKRLKYTNYVHNKSFLILLENKNINENRGNFMISVIIPAYNEEKNIKTVIDICKENKNVSEIIVVNNLSTDKTEEVAKRAGAKVIFCDKQGKGYAMEIGIREARNECIVFLDGDISDYADDVIYKLSEPILNRNVDFVKATFDRDGGRVTELVAKPMLNLLFPNVKKYTQPLSGMIAGKKSIFEKIELEKDYGVDIGILLDMIKLNVSIEEVKIGKIQNVSKSWKALEKMSTEVMKAILKRADIKC